MSDMAKAYIVLGQPRPVVFGVYLDEDTAHRDAKTIEGLVLTLPIVADYRPNQHGGAQ